MNEKKISIIMCCNNDLYVEESLLYLNELNVPEGYELDFIEIRGAKSMCAGCNEGMHKSDAKYKIYMHQDVFITNKNFLVDILRLFQENEDIGLIGMVGTPRLYKDATMWNGIRFGGFYRLNKYREKGVVGRFFPMQQGYMEMEAVDGLLMATQYDLPWREDVFTKWDFYDVSQSFEFRKAGYKVVVPGQEKEWYIHDCGKVNLTNYQEQAAIFKKIYAAWMRDREAENWEKYQKEVFQSVENGFYGSEDYKKLLLENVTQAVSLVD